MTATPRPDHSPGPIRVWDMADAETGVLRRLFLWVPPVAPPAGGWPLLVMSDGNAVIATAADAMRAQASWPGGTNLGWGALLAVGYPTDEAYDPLQRSWDLGPPPGQVYPPFHVGGPDVRTGGAAAFARFLLAQAIPFVQAQIAIDRDDCSLFGHSFGGLFALWLMFTRPETFRTWIAASPSITWEGSALLRSLPEFSPKRPVRVFLGSGEWEGDDLAPFQRDAPDAQARLAAKARDRTNAAMLDLADALRGRDNVTVVTEIWAGETHMSVLPVAVNRALHAAFGLSRAKPA